MSQKQTVRIAQQLLAQIGSGAEPDESRVVQYRRQDRPLQMLEDSFAVWRAARA